MSSVTFVMFSFRSVWLSLMDKNFERYSLFHSHRLFWIKSAKCLWCLQFSALFTPPPLHISQKGKSIRCESSMFSIHHSFAVSSFFFSFFVPLGYFLYCCIISKDYCLDWLHDHQKKHFVLIIAIVIWL